MSTQQHCVAVIGGAVAGAEMARALADAGSRVVVFEQNPRPFGKIEDGLPRWHDSLQAREYARIRENLGADGVDFVPSTEIGRDIPFPELVDDWGFTGVVLACGAWRDRSLPVDGAEAWVDKGLVYQNPFIIWFNHSEDEAYDGPTFEIHDDAMVVGGGLASIDVCKVLMIECTRAALKERGVEVSVHDVELKGVEQICQMHDVDFASLGLKGCTLFYRRAVEDMPLMAMPDGADEKRQEKVRNNRRKILEKAMAKYGFHTEPLCRPVGLITEGDTLVGLTFERTRIEGGRVKGTGETFDRRGSYVISSIGSIPAPIGGIPMKGELFDFVDWDLGRIRDLPKVFATGNVATGKGNIVASRKHAREVAVQVVEAFLGLGEGGHEGEEALLEQVTGTAESQAEAVADAITRQPPLDAATLEQIRARVGARQREVGYTGDLDAWLTAHGA